MTISISTIIGARPQFIKAGAVSRAIAKFEELPENLINTGERTFKRINEKIIHTGQHFDDNMSEIFFEELEIPKPDYNLGIGGGTHGQNTGRMIEKIENILLNEKPEWVVVYGDTDSTLAGALAASKLHIPVAHVEAGLRSFNRRMPEEINRIVADQLSTVLFCPTDTAVENLKREGFPHKLQNGRKQRVMNVGDVMYDAALFYGDRSEERSMLLQALGVEPRKFVLATVHRAENTDDPFRLNGIIGALNDIAEEVPVILPLHPRTRKKLALMDSSIVTPGSSRLHFIDPVGYLDMVMLEKNARVIITDSGGVQKEAFFHGVPCVTVRDETEWVELVETGVNCLSGTGRKKIIKAFKKMKDRAIENKQLYGEGNSAFKIINALLEFNL